MPSRASSGQAQIVTSMPLEGGRASVVYKSKLSDAPRNKKHVLRGSQRYKEYTQYLSPTLTKEYQNIFKNFRPAYSEDQVKKYFMGKARHSNVVKLGQGVSGIAFLVKGDAANTMKNFMNASKHTIMGKQPARRDDIVIKVIYLHRDPQLMQNEFVQEITAFNKIQSTPPMVIGGKTFDASKHTPTLHMAGYMPTLGVLYIIQSPAKGDVLRKYTSQGVGASAVALASVEHALISFWFAGLAHSDMHEANVFIDPKTGNATIIDFGRTTLMSPEYTEKLKRVLLQTDWTRERLMSSGALHVFDPYIRPLLNAALLKTPYSGYWVNTSIVGDHIKEMCRMPTCSQDLLYKARLCSWVPSTRQSAVRRPSAARPTTTRRPK